MDVISFRVLPLQEPRIRHLNPQPLPLETHSQNIVPSQAASALQLLIAGGTDQPIHEIIHASSPGPFSTVTIVLLGISTTLRNFARD